MRNKINEDHIYSLTYGIEKPGVWPLPMDAQVAIDELARYFLGDNWTYIAGQSQDQINTEIVLAIESKYRGCKIKRKG